MTHAPDARVGAQIAGRYELASRIGRGGMGVVYRGVHVGTGRQLAVKLLASGADDAAGRRFLREARIAASVSHPNLVEVIDVGATEDGLMFLVLELLEGEPLDAHLGRKGRMRPEDALDALVPIVDALSALHAAGVVHRDVKPSNIFLSLDGTSRIVPKLLDLGISKRLEAGEALTETGMMLGTPHYMSPEQARGELDVGIGVDIWAMGVVLFEALASERPFSADTVPGLLHKIATERPPRIAERVCGLDAGVASVIDRALAYDPASRHASASDLAESLVEAAGDAGWTLTCRMPVGPRISLEPSPVHTPSAADLTPMLGSAGTPILAKPAVAPAAESTSPSPPHTRDLPAGSVALPLVHRPVSASGASPVELTPEMWDTQRAEPARPGLSADRSSAARSAPPDVADAPTTTPSERLRQLTPSPLRYVLPVAGALALGAALWVALSASEGPPGEARQPPRAAAEPIVTPDIEPDAGVTIARPQELAEPPPIAERPIAEPPPIAEPAARSAPSREGSRPPRRRPESPGEARPAEPVPLGTNAAPIIE